MLRRVCLGVAVVLVVVAAAVALGVRSFSLPRLVERSCISSLRASGCSGGRALARASWVTLSRDGRSVYAGAERAGTVVWFSRDRRTGRVRERGCVADGGRFGCSAGRGVVGARPVVVSGDGRFVYAGTGAGVLTFARSGSGALREVGCAVGRPVPGCSAARAVVGMRSLALSADGRFLYAGAHGGRALTVWARDGRTGHVREIECLSTPRRPGCRRVSGVVGPRFEIVTRRVLYVADEVGSQLTAFARDPRTGRVGRRLSCLQERGLHGCRRLRVLQDAHALVLSPDGRFLYVAAASSDAVLVLRRRDMRVLGCVESGRVLSGCRRVRALDGSHSLALARGGRVLYGVGTNDNAIAEFARSGSTGLLRQRPGARGCVGASRLRACARAAGLAGVHHVAVIGPDVYAVSERGDALVFLTDPTLARAAARPLPSP